MMKFLAIASPAPSAGLVIKCPKITVPDQSMSLQEILERFVREQPLAIGKHTFGSEGDSDDEILKGRDVEKVGGLDLVEKEDLIREQKDVQKRFEEQEARKKGEKAKKAAEEARAKLRAEIEQEVRKEAAQSAN